MATSDSVQYFITIEGLRCKATDRSCTKRQQELLVGRRLKKMKDLSGPMRKISIYLDKWVQDNFRTEGGKVGGWDLLAAGGRYTSGVFDPTAKILQDTGRGRASYIPFATNKNAGIGSDLPYMKKHHGGEEGLPERRTLPLREEVIDDTRKILEEHGRKALK